MLRIFQAFRGVSRVWFARFEQRWNEGQTFQHASGKPLPPQSGKIPASSKAGAAAAATAVAIHHRLHPRKKSKNWWGRHTPSIEKKIEKEFMYEDWLHSLHGRRFKTKLEICKNADKELSDIRAIRRHSAEIIIPSRMTNYVMFHKGVTHTEEHKEKVTHIRGVHILSK